MIISDDEGLYSLAMMFLYILKDHPDYAVLSQLSYILDRKNFDDFIDYFGGTTITIPTRDEVNSAFKSMIYYQSRYIEGKSYGDSIWSSGANEDDVRSVTKNARRIAKMMDDIKDDKD